MDTNPANCTTRHPLARRVGAGASIAAFAVACVAPAASATAVDPALEGAGSSLGHGYSGYSGSPGTAAAATSTAVDPGTRTDAAGVLLVKTETASGGGAGTGMVLTSGGLALTNHHVVEDSTEVRVTVADTGAVHTATVVGKDEANDVAVLQLKDASALETVSMDDDGTRPGEAVAAIGNGRGQGYLTTVAGVLESTGESLTTRDAGGAGERLSGLLATDTDVVPGYSGGPLVDADGEVVGMTTAASTGSEINGYAVPVATALGITEQVAAGDESGAVDIGPDAALGVAIASPAAAASGPRGDGQPMEAGAAVVDVTPESVADAAGLTVGSTITAIGGVDVGDHGDLARTLSDHEPGDTVSMSWKDADGANRTGSAVLDASGTN